MRIRRALACAASAILLLLPPTSNAEEGTVAPAGIVVSATTSAPVVLEVPFVPQSQALCGGAAAAMVLRYWGERDVFAEDFAGLIRPARDGIEAGRLASALAGRGFVAHVAAADLESVSHHLARGRPPILLVELGGGRRHYVVAVAWSGRLVLVHDPADRPFRVWAQDELDKAWARTGRLMLIVLPSSPGGEAPAGAEHPGPFSTTEDVVESRPGEPAAPQDCGGLVPDAIARAKQNDLDGAGLRLEAAARLCPATGVPRRELAGVRFRQQRYSEAASLAAEALSLAPADELSWRLLATSRYLLGENGPALGAWNRLGEPIVDLVSVEGLDRTRPAVVSSRLGIAPRSLLTPADWRRASRRLAAMPTFEATRLRMRPVGSQRVELTAAVVERPLVPGLRPLLAQVAVDAAQHRQTRLALASLGGEGGRLEAGVRWWRRRPAGWVSLDAPQALGLPGIVTLEAVYEEQRYAGETAPSSVVVERRRCATLASADWLTAELHARGSLALERVEGRGTAAVVGLRLERRLADDRVALVAGGSRGLPLGGGDAFTTGEARVALRTSAAPRPAVALHARAGFSSASARAPLARWAGAGTGSGRDLLLRAHPLLSGGVLGGDAFGRRLLDGGLEIDVRLRSAGWARIAGFVDVARAFERVRAPGGGPWLADVGAGVRLRLPGAGRLRLDVATPVTEERLTVSVGWQPPWPR